MESSPARILIVDDSLTIRRALEFILKPPGYALEFAADGREALDRARDFQPDLILLDYVLPDMRGPDVCSALSAIPATAQTPVILVSAKGASIRQAYQDAQNVVSYITKPFKPQVVLSVVDKALARPQVASPSVTEPKVVTAPEPSDHEPVSTAEPATLDETFSALLGQLEDAVSAETRREIPAARTLARLTVPLRRAREQLLEIGQHLEEDGVAPYRLRPDGSFANVASTLMETHRLLCEATLALAATGAPGPELPTAPNTILVTDSASVGDAASALAERPDVLRIDREWRALPYLIALVRPEFLVVFGLPEDAALDALGEITEAPSRRIVITENETDLSGTPLADFERLSNGEALAEVLGPSPYDALAPSAAVGLEVVNL